MKLTSRLPGARSLLAGLAVASFFLGVFGSFSAVVVVHRMRAAELASAIWGVLVLASFAGWGSALNTWLFPHRRADFWLRCAWGWGVTLAIGGFLAALSLAQRVTLLGLTGVGLFLLCLGVVEACQRWGRGATWLRRRRVWLLAADAPFLAGAAAIFALGALQAFAAILTNAFSANDDLLAYFPFAREILERGTLTQPFSFRRISDYGGKSLLDAVALAIDVPETHLQLLDKGLATLTILGLIFGHRRSSRRSSRILLLLAMLFVVALPDTASNTTAMRTAVVFFFGLYRTMTWAPVAEGRDLRAAVPIALLAAGACTLRQSYLVTVAVLLVLAYAPPILRGLRLRPLRVDRAALRDAATTVALVVALLVPWWALSLRWCGTFLFPLVKGSYDPEYPFFPWRGLGWFQYLWANASYLNPIKAIPIFLVAALAMRDRAPRTPLAALVGAAFLGFMMLLFGYPAAEPVDQSRCYFGFTFAAILALALAAADLAARSTWTGARRQRVEQAACVSLVILGLGMQLYEERDRLAATYRNHLGQLVRDWGPWVRSGRDPVYQALQGPVPASAPIATLVENPSRFDHRRNRIACLDLIGAVSPRPGIPLAAGAEAVAAYLLAHGYRYLIVVHPDAAKGLYQREGWVKQKDASPVTRLSARFYLEAFDDFDELRRTRAHLAEVGQMTTLDLATRKP